MTISKTAKAFLLGVRGTCHNAHTDGATYYLHGNPIAKHLPAAADGSRSVEFNWCGWYTVTTANHMNHIIGASNGANKNRVGYASARDSGEVAFERVVTKE